MGAAPEDTIARTTNGETLLSKENVRRNSFKDRFLVHVLQGNVALEAAGKDIELFEIECVENLIDLLPVVAALNQDTFLQEQTRAETHDYILELTPGK